MSGTSSQQSCKTHKCPHGFSGHLSQSGEKKKAGERDINPDEATQEAPKLPWWQILKTSKTQVTPFFFFSFPIVTSYVTHTNYTDKAYYWLIKMMAGFLPIEVNGINNFVGASESRIRQNGAILVLSQDSFFRESRKIPSVKGTH